ncbi:MAG: alanine--glyoxylate aminotransferase family protein [Rhodospirillales bacterium]|nr:MAG: alanine--glyoxylate aminotransferase family protein [Rhodospirillales bacterium]
MPNDPGRSPTGRNTKEPIEMESFIAPRRILMGAGPTEIPNRVLSATARPTLGHLDPAFVALMEEVKALLRYAFRTTNDVTFPLSAPGSAGMEVCFVNLVEPGDRVIVCRNGVFGERMRENVVRLGGEAIVVDHEWGEPVSVERLAEALRANPGVKAVAFVHAETSTGAQSDAAEICALAEAHGALTIVDTVTSLGGTPVCVDEWGADAVYSGTQKCLACPPGLAPVTFSPRAIAAVKARKAPAQSWFLDLNLVLGYWDGGDGGRSYHHTAPVNAIYGLHEALVMLKEEGLEQSWTRHRDNHEILKAGLGTMGLDFLVDADHRLPQMNVIKVPDGIDEAAVRRDLMAEHAIDIGAGLGPLAGRVWRIGLMGQAVRLENIMRLLSGLETALIRQGRDLKRGNAICAARHVAASFARAGAPTGERAIAACAA